MHAALNALCITNRSGTGRYAWGLIDGFVKSRPANFFLSVLIPSDFSIPEAWREADWIRFYSIPIYSVLHRLVWEQWSLPGWLKTIKPDVLHSPAFIAPVLRRVSVPQVVTVHDLAFLRYPQTIPIIKRYFYQWIIPLGWCKGEAVITDSQAVAAEISGLPNPPAWIAPIHLGVDAARFHPRSEQGDGSIIEQYGLSNPYLLFVGTREPRKNLDVLLHAYKIARSRGFSDDLVIAGRVGWMEGRNQLDNPGVKWLGHVNDKLVPALYRRAQVVLAPSLYEGFDLPSVEALACGASIIASDIAVHREVLQDSAVYATVDSVDEWVNAIMNCGNKPPLSRSNVREWMQVSKETMKIYEDLYTSHDD